MNNGPYVDIDDQEYRHGPVTRGELFPNPHDHRASHTCEECVIGCQCSIDADEPSGKCPIHAGYWEPPRCRFCGRWMPWRNENEAME